MLNEEFDIGWSNKAGKDLLSIKQYLCDNASEAVAEKVLFKLFNSVEPTRLQPERFPIEPRLKKYGNYRFIKVWSYKIIYEFTGNQIIVHRIIHTKQNMKRQIRYFR